MTADYQRIRTTALMKLEQGERPTREQIRITVQDAATFLGVPNGGADVDALCAELEASLSVEMARGHFLDGDKQGHEEWLTDALTFRREGREECKWLFWRRYKRYLREVKRWPPRVCDVLDQTTTDILKRLEDPKRPGSWDRRGMVVGAVQSGKTANFTGVVCKAADAGYKIIVVLAGMHNNLRSQTQSRLDREFFGQDSDRSRAYDKNNQRIGVALMRGEEMPIVHTLTTSANNGDFSRPVASQAGFTPGGDPIFLVVKKHVQVLKNLNQWLRTIQQYNHERRRVEGVPLLVIDDECDQASINTRQVDPNDRNYDVTAINGQIRRLLNVFDQSAYVGYTATPFANVFIDPDTPHEDLGPDLFPRHFILNLPRPSNYVGPGRVFGYAADHVRNEPGTSAQPVVVPVEDPEDFIPGRHRTDLHVRQLPPSLVRAIRVFVLACAARRTRGQVNVHNTMLVHVSRFNHVQGQVAQLVDEAIKEIQLTLRYADDSGHRERLLDELRTIWDADFVPTTQEMGVHPDMPAWETVEAEVLQVVHRIGTKVINGEAGDVLEYDDHPDGLHAIAIGGDKLSRGLTLEGLTVSYYLRAASMFDTLMQMGRWFGYRPGYEDLCRIYTTREIIELYRWIAMAEDELREDFDDMVRLRRTPDDFGLRVRTHPDGVLITSMTKQRHGRRMRLTYADDVRQTFTLDLSPETVHHNLEQTDRFVARLGPPIDPPRGATALYWSDVAADEVIDFLEGYILDDPIKGRITTDLLRRYIAAQNIRGKLTHWSVALANPQSGNTQKASIGGHQVRMVKRKNEGGLERSARKVTLNTVLDRGHEAIDLGAAAYERAMEETRRKHHQDQNEERIPRDRPEPTVPRPHDIRRERPPSRGLLILYAIDPEKSEWTKPRQEGEFGLTLEEPVVGWVISFPHDPDHETIEYTVNARYDDDA